MEEGNENDSSLYYTPRDTPQREVAMDEKVIINKTSSLKNTPNKETIALCTSEAPHPPHSQKPAYKTHKKSKSLGSYMPHKWLFNGSEPQPPNPDPPKVNGNGPNGHQRTVRAIIEHVTSNGSSDYLDEASNIQPVDVRDKHEEPLDAIAKVDDVDIVVVESELVGDDLLQPAPLAATDEVILSDSEEEEEEVLTIITETKVNEDNKVDDAENSGGVETDSLLKNCPYVGVNGSPV